MQFSPVILLCPEDLLLLSPYKTLAGSFNLIVFHPYCAQDWGDADYV